MAYYEYPHSRIYDQDLGWIINELERIRQELEDLKVRVEKLEVK